MKYVGPFLRMNTLSPQIIKRQLLYLSKESFKHIILHSRAGLTTPVSSLKLKNQNGVDSGIYKRNLLPLCIYKKSSSKLITDGHHPYWDEKSFKKEISICPNAYMNLILLELIDYYNLFEEKDEKLFTLSKVYSGLARKQMDFFIANLRNIEGVFVDKKDCSDNITGELNFEEKTEPFSFSDQALLMSSLYRLSELKDLKNTDNYKDFYMDILNMFIEYKDELYNLSLTELNNLCFSLNVFYSYSKLSDARLLLIDICDLLVQKYNEDSDHHKDKMQFKCLMYLNLFLLEKNTAICTFNKLSLSLYEALKNMYNEDSSMILKDTDKKYIKFDCEEIMLYILTLIMHSKHQGLDDTSLLPILYKKLFINSGILASWPDSPTLENPEKYTNFSFKPDDLLEDINFRFPTMPTPDSIGFAPVFIKNVKYNIRKDTFEQGKLTFDSRKNLPLLFYIIFLLKEM